MSRPAIGHRPNHITLPTGPFVGRSPNESPAATPTGGMASPTSPRNSFLPNFMSIRQRARAATLSTSTGNSQRVATSPGAEIGNPLATRNGHEASGAGVTRTVSTPATGVLTNGHGNAVNGDAGPAPDIFTSTQHTNGAMPTKTYRIRLVPHLETSRSLAFDPVVRELLPIVVTPGISPSVAAASVVNGPIVNGRLPALILKIGRFTDKTTSHPAVPATPGAGPSGGGTLGPASRASAAMANGNGHASGMGEGTGPGGFGGPPITIAGGGGDVTSGKIAFRSKVVSRSHAEIWCIDGGKFYIRDAASSSGTFLNHIRLSSPNTESRPTQINDGDVLQLGVDYQGGHEDMFRCVKMRVELGREWQRGANEFNTNAMKQLKPLGGATPEGKSKAAELANTGSAKKGKASVTDCCICLFSVTVCQSLFIAPCSHVFHYKCIRPLLTQHHPGFSCPLCRTFANLEEDVETEDAWEIASRRASIISRRPSNHSIRFPYLAEVPVESQSSTSIGFGRASASVDELLGGGSGTASEEGGLLGSAPLARQVTAVQENGDVDVYLPEAEALYEEEDDGGGISPGFAFGDDPDCLGSLAVLTDPTMLDRSYSNSNSGPSTGIPMISASEPLPPDHGELATSINGRTTMNYSFLSTLASGLSDPLATGEPGTGTRRLETVMNGEHADTQRGTEVQARAQAERQARRGDLDMMFT